MNKLKHPICCACGERKDLHYMILQDVVEICRNHKIVEVWTYVCEKCGFKRYLEK